MPFFGSSHLNSATSPNLGLTWLGWFHVIHPPGPARGNRPEALSRALFQPQFGPEDGLGFFFDWHPKIGHCNAKNKDLFYWPPKFNLTIKKASFFFLPCNSQQYRNSLIFNAFDSVTHHFFNQAD